ncbi:exodeoxyribonuclease V subunit alpha, partial [Paraburkholderia sp. SIMBA_049]
DDLQDEAMSATDVAAPPAASLSPAAAAPTDIDSVGAVADPAWIEADELAWLDAVALAPFDPADAVDAANAANAANASLA